MVFSTASGVFFLVEGQGDARLLVPGIAEELTRELDRGDRNLRHEWLVTLAVAALVATTTIGAALAPRFGVPPDLRWVVGAVQPVAGLPALWLLARSFIVPKLALLPAGDQSRDQRWGRKALGLGRWALTLVAGAVLGQVIENWLS